MTDPTPKPVWVSALAARHVQEPAPDARPAEPADPTPEDAVQEVERLRQEIDECWVPLYHGALAERDEQQARAERAESNARGKQAVIEAQRATLDRVRALHVPDAADAYCDECGWRWPCETAAILDAPQPEADLTEQGRRLASERDDLIASGVDPATLAVPLAPRPEAGGDDEPKGLHSPHCNPGCLGFTHYLGSVDEEHLHHADRREVCEACADPEPEAGGDDE